MEINAAKEIKEGPDPGIIVHSDVKNPGGTKSNEASFGEHGPGERSVSNTDCGKEESSELKEAEDQTLSNMQWTQARVQKHVLWRCLLTGASLGRALIFSMMLDIVDILIDSTMLGAPQRLIGSIIVGIDTANSELSL